MLIYSNKQNEKNSTTVNEKKKRNTNIALSKLKKKDVHKKSFFFLRGKKKRNTNIALYKFKKKDVHKKSFFFLRGKKKKGGPMTLR